MPSGTSDSKLTNKTEFMRFLDTRPEDVRPLRVLLMEYRAEPRQRGTFGMWMRNKRFAKFHLAYQNWWLKHEEHYGKVYEF